MPTHIAPAAHQRANKRARTNPLSAGLPDPRPITDYAVEYSEADGNSVITIKLEQPCIIRAPQWGFIDCSEGNSISAASVKSEDNSTIIFTFDGIISIDVIMVDVPYQDLEVQNFQGGFVRPGGKWFRKPF